MGFDSFVQLALYDPAVGYYRQPRRRIGYGGESDFVTATAGGPVFGELICAASVQLLGGRDPKEFKFIEIGAESEEGVLAGVDCPFGRRQTVRIGESGILAGPCIVFSNELFDAQPFRRFAFRRGRWRELGVAVQDGGLVEVELAEPAPPPPLPPAADDGQLFDAPEAAASLAATIAAQPWTGVFVAIDYGKSWRELTEATPAGTARAYCRQTLTTNLLARPGEQDLTCHVCWDWLAAALRHHGFPSPNLDSQESFFLRHAGDWIARTSANEASHFSRRKQSLQQLLHPAHFGQKFQVLHALRGPIGENARER
jgi:SAM-dependent MidA family methyltransferase